MVRFTNGNAVRPTAAAVKCWRSYRMTGRRFDWKYSNCVKAVRCAELHSNNMLCLAENQPGERMEGFGPVDVLGYLHNSKVAA